MLLTLMFLLFSSASLASSSLERPNFTSSSLAKSTLEKHDFKIWAKNLKRESLEALKHNLPQAKAILENKQRCSVKSRCFKKSPKNEVDPDLLIFVSFSMPLATLKVLADEAVIVGGKLVFRGLVAGDFKKTALKFKELKREALIDPTMFRDHQISQVPVFIQGKNRIAGNVSLNYALEQFALKGEHF